MRAPFSFSKNPKKNSDEDRSRKKKIKSKSAKRRRDSSSSSSEPDSRSRRKRSKSKKLEKRRRESKKSDKKRSRKRRYRRDSSSVSGESCSTCSDSERSRSPVRKSNLRKRDRKSSRRSGRYRSLSCSTCSGGRSRSCSRSPVAIEERFGGRSCRRSPVAIEERFAGRSRSRSPVAIEERFAGRTRSRSPVAIEEIFGGRSRNCSPVAIEERYGGRSRSRSPVPIEEERFGTIRGRSPAEERYGEVEMRRVKSVLAMTKTSDEDGDKIIKAYDDYPSSRSNENWEVGNEKRNLEVEIKEKGSYDKRIRDEVILSKDGKRLIKDSDGTAEGYFMRKESEVVVEDGGNEADELELILRQKALENFRKFRGGRPAIKESLNDKKDETSKFESYHGSQNFAKQLESKHPSSTDDQRHVQKGPNPNESKPSTVANVPTWGNDGNAVRSLSNDIGGLGPVASSINSQKAPNQSKLIPNQPKARSVSNVPMEENDRNAAHGLSNNYEGSKPVASSITSQKTQNPLKREQESSKKMPAEETSLAKDNQNLKGVTETGSGKASKAEVCTADTPVTGALNTENQNSKSNEPVAESVSGSQFEQKTFSRMRDGEVVQVSYKVYIPKKTPALARRQLKR